MGWKDGLLTEQEKAAGHTGSHARLLAGPGTGKTLTLTRRIRFLVEEKKASPNSIRAFTFTRAAAKELDQRVRSDLGAEKTPRISTLHSFALRQLMNNESIVQALPKPLRIADDWEERYIVREDLKAALGLPDVRDADRLLNRMSADWQSLTADESDWEQKFPDAQFLGAWREHRQLYGYTLRSELVYQLKKVLEQREDFKLESPIDYLLVDEYQDLNRCDLAVVQYIETKGVELFIAGDDDQSIYGFREAHPEGIRRFLNDFPSSQGLELEICKRCDEDILNAALFVAKQDSRRIEKSIQTEPGTPKGEVAVLRFDNEYKEADGVAELCKRLLQDGELEPHDILILLRADRNGQFSGLITERLNGAGIPVAATTEGENPLDKESGRSLMAFLHLATREQDGLAWRTLLTNWCSGIGPKAIEAIHELARSKGTKFAETIMAIHNDPTPVPSTHRNRLSSAIKDILKKLETALPASAREEFESREDLVKAIQAAAASIVTDQNEIQDMMNKIGEIVEGTGATSISELTRIAGAGHENAEQERQDGKVNILTMHRAKGLTAEAVFICATENEYIPGRAQGEAVDDERRLLYVSLTRAKHHLFITFCNNRIGPQMHTGTNRGKTPRQLTQFLVDYPQGIKSGQAFISAWRAT